MSPLPSVANTRAFRMADAQTGAPLTGVAVVYYLTALSGAHAGKFWDSVSGGWVDFLMYATGITAIPLGVGSGNWQATAPDTAWEDGVAYFEWMKDENNIAVPVGRQVRCEAIREELAAQGSQLSTIRARTDRIGSGFTVAQAPVSVRGAMTIHPGDSYEAEHGTAITFTDSGTWPGDSVANLLRIRHGSECTTLLEVYGTLSAGPPQALSFDLPSAETAILPRTRAKYEVVLMFADGDATTIAAGECMIR